VIWVAHDIRDAVVELVRYWSEFTELPVRRFLEWIELSPRKFGRCQQRFGKLNEHNGLVPQDHQIEDWERQAMIAFFYEYPLEGYRRLAFMMLDRNLVAVSPSTVYRLLKGAGLLQDRFSRPPPANAKASYSHWNYTSKCGSRWRIQHWESVPWRSVWRRQEATQTTTGWFLWVHIGQVESPLNRYFHSRSEASL
jgi:hypothetical protein